MKSLSFSKKVLITGATSGIGRATAKLFSKRGYDVILTGRRQKRLNELKRKFEAKYGSKVKTLCFDVRDKKACKKAYQSLDPDWKKIDILINNAGLAQGFGPIQDGNLDDWETMIDTNIKGLLYVTRLVAKDMVKRKSGHIINVCSIAGHEAYPGGNVYCASKFAVDALTKTMRLDLYKHNVRVGQVSPGHVEETEFAKVRFDGDEEKAQIYDDFNPLRSKDVAFVIYFMANQPKYVNIHDIILTGSQQAGSNFIDKSGRKY